MNTTPCGNCAYYDPIVGPNKKNTHRGWCVNQSKYPNKEGPGQLFPKNCQRVASGELAQPVIVQDNDVRCNCQNSKQTNQDLFEQKISQLPKE